jgi:hypothetical protein
MNAPSPGTTFFSRRYKQTNKEGRVERDVRACCTPIWPKQMLFGGDMEVFNVLIWPCARSAGLREDGAELPFNNLENRGAEPTRTWDEPVSPCWMRRVARGSIAARRRFYNSIAISSHARHNAAGEAAALRSRHEGPRWDRQAVDRAACCNTSLQRTRARARCRAQRRPASMGHGSGREPAISFRLHPISSGAAKGRRGAAGRHDLGRLARF